VNGKAAGYAPPRQLFADRPTVSRLALKVILFWGILSDYGKKIVLGRNVNAHPPITNTCVVHVGSSVSIMTRLRNRSMIFGDGRDPPRTFCLG
jgi:hypothetical protein